MNFSCPVSKFLLDDRKVLGFCGVLYSETFKALCPSPPISCMSATNFFSLFQIPDQESARKARPGDPFTFTVDASKTGWGEVAIDVVYDNRSIRRTFYVEEVGNRIYNVWNNKIVL